MSAKGPKVDPVALAKGLHGEQQAILVYIYRKSVLGADNTPLGLPWKPNNWGYTPTPARRASCSRSLERLEKRGLVLRQNWRTGTRKSAAEPHHRTTHVVLTGAGRAVAEGLSREFRARQQSAHKL
jgi:hypothetical protein